MPVERFGTREDWSMSMANLLATIEHLPELTTFVTMLRRARLADLLRRPAPLTLFAPTETAFANMPEAARTALERDPVQQMALVARHLVPGALVAADLMLVSSVVALGGKSRAVDTALGLRIDHAYLVKADILADNGVIHEIDTVLAP
jgi:uncharacterized surface protein with fasciclin (FAS1) repeats